MADPGFSRVEGANHQGGGANLLFGRNFPEKCMKMKEFGPGGRVPGASLKSAKEIVLFIMTELAVKGTQM